MVVEEASRREGQVVDAFVDLADSLVADYDPLEFLYRLIEHGVPLTGADAAGVLLHYQGALHLVAASNEASEDVEVFEVQADEGPARDAFASGEPVRVDDLADAAGRWPGFVERTLKAGWSSAFAHPLRLRDHVVGAFVTFHSDPQSLDATGERLLRGFADVATIAVLQRQATADVETINEQLHQALESRLKIEQAKGMVAHGSGLTPGEAFAAIRKHARSTQQPLKRVAAEVVDGSLDPSSFA